MQIKVISTEITTKPTAKGSYQQLELTYKNLTFQGKVEAKKLMSFGANADAFKTLSVSLKDDVFEIESIKNTAGYLDWIKCVKSTETTPSGNPSVTNNSGVQSTVRSSTYETAEERAKKQVYIVRQSSLSASINTLSCGAKSVPKSDEVIELAKKYEAYVFDLNLVPKASVVDEFPQEAQ